MLFISIYISHQPTHRIQKYLEGLFNSSHGLLQPQQRVLEILAVRDGDETELVILVDPQHEVVVVVDKHS